MKTPLQNLLFLSLFLISFGATSQVKVHDSTIMGPAYANEVYYNFDYGDKFYAPVKNWDLAFRTGIMSDGIFINSTNGVKLYMVPNTDISGWSTLDTANYESWPEYYNTDTTWEKGAFNISEPSNIFTSWGTYNQTTHIVTGDSLYLIKLTTGPVTEFKKFWIVKKEMGDYVIRYANLDNSGDRTVTIGTSSTDFQKVNFGYYSLRNDTLLNREPATGRWDIVFTRYWAEQQGTVPYYQVTGILSNIGVKVAEVAGLDPETVSAYDKDNYSSNISTIGYDWKTPPAGPPPAAWSLDTMRCYFVKTLDGNIWKIVLYGFDGSATGKTVFYKTNYLTSINTDRSNPVESMAIYPNPASGSVSIVLSANISANALVQIQDISGRVQRTQDLKLNSSGLQQEVIDLQGMAPGIYILSVVADGYATQQKLMIR